MALRLAYERFLDLTGVVIGLSIGMIAMLMCLDVLGRNAPALLASAGILLDIQSRGLPWVTELSEYLLYSGTFIAAPWVLHQGGHVRVDAFTSRLSARAASAFEVICSLSGLGVSLILVVYGVAAVHEAWVMDMVARKTWNVPEWILLLPIPYSGVMLAIEFVLILLGISRPSGQSASL